MEREIADMLDKEEERKNELINEIFNIEEKVLETEKIIVDLYRQLAENMAVKNYMNAFKQTKLKELRSI